MLIFRVRIQTTGTSSTEPPLGLFQLQRNVILFDYMANELRPLCGERGL